MMALKSIIGKFVPSSLPSNDAFSGQTILVTGGTSGLGLAAAVHFLNLGADEVIITARNASSPLAEEAKRNILAKKKVSTTGQVTVMGLDMNSYASCAQLVDGLRRKFEEQGGTKKGGLDVAVLNAGALNNKFVKSPEGLEETIQINTLSTTYLAMLLLPWMKQYRSQRSAPSRMVFVSSVMHLDAVITSWPSYISEDGGVLAHYSKKENFPTSALFSGLYPVSKLMLQYSIEELTKIALNSDGTPDVIIAAVCPGPVRTGISRNIKANSLLLKLVVPVFFLSAGKSPDYGARIYVAASLAKPEQHGKFLSDLLTDKQYQAKSMPVLTSTEARKMQARVWTEIKEILDPKLPVVRETPQQYPV